MINCYNTSKLKSHPTAMTCGSLHIVQDRFTHVHWFTEGRWGH